MLYWILAILALSLLIVFHEFGHLWIARRSGMKVLRFSIGFGPSLAGFTHNDIYYQIGAIPFGGFVQIAGMDPEDPERDAEGSFEAAPLSRRLAVIFAGPGANYLLGGVLMFVITAIWGLQVPTGRVQVMDVVSGSPSEISGLRGGDVVLDVDGTAVGSVQELIGRVLDSEGSELTLSVSDGTAERSVRVTPARDGDDAPFRIGASLAPETRWESASIGAALMHGMTWPFEQSWAILGQLWQMITGRAGGGLSGPVGIAQQIAQAFERGLADALQLVALLNIFLGLFNLLPVPALDGGRLVFLAYNVITGHRANARVETIVHAVGLIALLAILFIATIGDVRRLFQ